MTTAKIIQLVAKPAAPWPFPKRDDVVPPSIEVPLYSVNNPAPAAEVIALQPEKQRPLLVEYAVASMLGNVEEVSNWLAGECSDHTKQTSGFEARTADRLARADTATVFHALLEAADNRDVSGCMEAASLLVRRYIEVHDDLLQQEMSLIEAELGGRA